MKKALYILLIVLMFTSCCETIPLTNSYVPTEKNWHETLTPSSSPDEFENKNIEIIYNDSFPVYNFEPSCSLEFAEASFYSYFSLLTPSFHYDNIVIDINNPLSAEYAYYLFEVSLQDNYHKIENYDDLTQKTDNLYVQYYPQKVVEKYISTYYGVSIEEIKEIEEYDLENGRYLKNYYGGLGKGSATILKHKLINDIYIADFIFEGSLHQTETICGHIELKYDVDHFVLIAFSTNSFN